MTLSGSASPLFPASFPGLVWRDVPVLAGFCTSRATLGSYFLCPSDGVVFPNVECGLRLGLVQGIISIDKQLTRIAKGSSSTARLCISIVVERIIGGWVWLKAC